MIDATSVLRVYAAAHARRLAHEKPQEVQRQVLSRLLHQAAATRFGQEHGFEHLREPRDFAAAVPLRRYEDFWTDYWQAEFPTLIDCTWPGLVPFFAATSGTSTGNTKHVPVTRAMIRSNRRGALQLLTHHLRARPHSRIFGGRNLLLGGSTALVERAPGVRSGDLSGIAAATAPRWARPYSFPTPAIARLTDWTEKMALIAASAPADIRSIAGVPSWLLLFFDELARHHYGHLGRLADFFPGLELVVHGGVNFAPYRHRFAEWLQGSDAELREVYAASEGFIAAAEHGEDEGLRLVLNHGIFYEFVPVGEVEKAMPTRHTVAEVETGVDYAPVLSTCAGLWGYIVGDRVRFLSRDPPRLVVTGRLSYTLSAFGEHLTGEEVEAAVAAAAAAIGADLRDFAAGALYPEKKGEIGGHLYVVEFEGPVAPLEVERFAEAIDRDLAARNLDYREHRADGFGLKPPQVIVLTPGGFAEWLRRHGRLGAQNKVPRIIAEPGLFADLRAFAAERSARP